MYQNNKSNQAQQQTRDCFVLAQRKSLTTDQWLAIRRNGISGTDASIIMGLNKFSSPLKLFLQKTGVISDKVDPNPKMLFGIRMESILRKWYAEDSGNEVKEVPAILANRERKWQIADVDGIVYEIDQDGNKIPGVLEIKTSTFGDELQGDNSINPMWYCQLMHYISVTGCSFGIIYALVNNELHTIRVERNEDVIDALIAKEEEFYKALKDNNVPAIQVFDNSIMNQLFPASKPSAIKLSDEYIPLLTQLDNLKKQEAELKEQRDLIEAKLKSAIGENEAAECDLYKITWKSSVRNSFSTDKVKTFLTEEQLKQCMTTTQIRTLRISKAKPKATKR